MRNVDGGAIYCHNYVKCDSKICPHVRISSQKEIGELGVVRLEKPRLRRGTDIRTSIHVG